MEQVRIIKQKQKQKLDAIGPWLNLHTLAILAEVGNGCEERIDLV